MFSAFPVKLLNHNRRGVSQTQGNSNCSRLSSPYTSPRKERETKELLIAARHHSERRSA